MPIAWPSWPRNVRKRWAGANRAQAAFKTFLTDYPGSPLVENVKQKLAELARPIEDKKPARPTKPTKPSRKP